MNGLEDVSISQSKKKTKDIKTSMSSQKSTSAMCKGLYNPSAYTRLVTICRDCFNLYKEPEVYSLCMGGCFDSQHFMHCAKTLLLEEKKAKTLINQVGKSKIYNKQCLFVFVPFLGCGVQSHPNQSTHASSSLQLISHSLSNICF